MKKIILLMATLIAFISAIAFANEVISESPEGAKVYFITPQNGQNVSQAFKVKFGLNGMGVAPAGINVKNTGHHHILINTDISEIDFTKPLPSTEKIKHFGSGQTETELTLPKGKHTLQLLLGNYVHIPHDKPVMSEKIMIVVK